jgi:N-acetyl-D-muramate 6-phosphate phosphatase
MPDPRPQAVLFDLDGTFADTAPDLGAALNRLREEAGVAPLPLATLRPFVSQGVRGMLRVGFGMLPEHADYREHYDRFLTHYQRDLCAETCLFEGIGELVDALESAGIAWGIVTNKSQRFTLPLMDALGYARRAACIVSGDSAPRAKPHANPMLLACALAETDPEKSVFIGDDIRDIAAGRTVGMTTIAATYGYLGDGGPVEHWGADHLASTPTEITSILFRN